MTAHESAVLAAAEHWYRMRNEDATASRTLIRAVEEYRLEKRRIRALKANTHAVEVHS